MNVKLIIHSPFVAGGTIENDLQLPDGSCAKDAWTSFDGRYADIMKASIEKYTFSINGLRVNRDELLKDGDTVDTYFVPGGG